MLDEEGPVVRDGEDREDIDEGLTEFRNEVEEAMAEAGDSADNDEASTPVPATEAEVGRSLIRFIPVSPPWGM